MVSRAQPVGAFQMRLSSSTSLRGRGSGVGKRSNSLGSKPVSDVTSAPRDRRRVCAAARRSAPCTAARSEEHTSELQSLMRISYAVFCLKKKKKNTLNDNTE